MTIEAVFQAICERPEDDDARLHYADLIESSDPDHAAYIRLSIADATRRRHGLDSASAEVRAPLLRAHGNRWAHNLLRFLPRYRTEDEDVLGNGVLFDRGFPTEILIHPFVFLEYADLLFRLAPIRHVRLREPYDQEEYLPGPVPTREDGTFEPFPLDQILAMPQLSRLDSFGFEMDSDWHQLLPEDTWAKVAACPYLTRCRVLDTDNLQIYSHLDALAVGRLTGKMLRLEPIFTTSMIGEYRYDESDAKHGDHTRTIFRETGRELEAKYGYIPWLHESHCKGDLFDIAYYVEQGDLPKYKPGTPQMEEWYEFPVEVHRRQPGREW